MEKTLSRIIQTPKGGIITNSPCTGGHGPRTGASVVKCCWDRVKFLSGRILQTNLPFSNSNLS
jgi:hypothetical protein